MPPAARTVVSAIRAIEFVCGPATRAAHGETHRLNRGGVAALSQNVRDERKAGVRAAEHEGVSFAICWCHRGNCPVGSACCFPEWKDGNTP
jgi:hypothetical protein